MTTNDDPRINPPTDPSTDPSTDAETETVPADTPPTPAPGWSGVAGILTVVLVLMAAGLLVAQIVSGTRGEPGPGALPVGAHVAGAVVGVWCYRVATRRRGTWRLAALLVLPLLTAVLAGVFWLSPW